jgi:hypothetical protein
MMILYVSIVMSIIILDARIVKKYIIIHHKNMIKKPMNIYANIVIMKDIARRKNNG